MRFAIIQRRYQDEWKSAEVANRLETIEGHSQNMYHDIQRDCGPLRDKGWMATIT